MTAIKIRRRDVSTSESVYEPRPVKRERRTQAELEEHRVHIIETLEEEHPQTLRQLYYRLVSKGFIEKTEKAYKSVGRLLVEMRVEGRVPFDWLADNTRWMRVPNTHDSVREAIAETARTYRRSYWSEADAYVEVWCEKDSVAGVILEETRQWAVPLMAARGFASITFLHSTAQTIQVQKRPAFIYYVGDHDPSGLAIDKSIEKRLRQFAPDANLTFERLAVLPDQIKNWRLPTRPTKTTDSRSKTFKGGSVEVEAIAPSILRTLVREAIERHVDPAQYQILKAAEESERGILLGLLSKKRGRRSAS